MKDGMKCSYVVARYKPAGNAKGEYQKNVFKGRFSKDMCYNLKGITKDEPEDSDSTDSVEGNIAVTFLIFKRLEISFSAPNNVTRIVGDPRKDGVVLSSYTYILHKCKCILKHIYWLIWVTRPILASINNSYQGWK